MLIASVKGVRINSNGKIPGSPAGQGKTLKRFFGLIKFGNDEDF